MKFDPTKPVQTRDGLPARILAADLKGRYPIVAVIGEGSNESVYCFAASGEYPGSQLGYKDLVNIPEKRIYERWVNTYPSGREETYQSRRHADSYAGVDRVACLHIQREYVKGEGLGL